MCFLSLVFLRGRYQKQCSNQLNQTLSSNHRENLILKSEEKPRTGLTTNHKALNQVLHIKSRSTMKKKNSTLASSAVKTTLTRALEESENSTAQDSTAVELGARARLRLQVMHLMNEAIAVFEDVAGDDAEFTPGEKAVLGKLYELHELRSRNDVKAWPESRLTESEAEEAVKALRAERLRSLRTLLNG